MMGYFFYILSKVQAILIVLALLLGWGSVYAYTFDDAVRAISSHDAVQALDQQSLALQKEGSGLSSWGDPVLSVSAQSFPVETLAFDESPMTGIAFGISQNIPVTNKFSKVQKTYDQLSQAKSYESQDKQRELMRSLWLILIENRNTEEEMVIIEENLHWIDHISTVSQRLYANGSISQQALLDIRIRYSELEAQLSNKKFEIQKQMDRLSYILDAGSAQLQKETIPWDILDQLDQEAIDTTQKVLEHTLASKEAALMAKKRDVISDVNVSIAYSMHSNTQPGGDFVSASIGFPFPVTKKKYAMRAKANHEKISMEKNLRNYSRYKKSKAQELKHQIQKINQELMILNQRTIEFAKNSRQVSSKSYSHGSSSYIELLQSELKLQKLLLQRTQLNGELRASKLSYKFLMGEKLHD